MTWVCIPYIYSQGVVEDSFQTSSQDTKLWEQLREKNMPKEFCSQDSLTEACLYFLFGMMSAHSDTTTQPVQATSTGSEVSEINLSSPVVSLAKTYQLQGKEQESTAKDQAYGKSLRGLLAKLDQDTLTWKIPQQSLIEDLEQSLETWPVSGTMRNGVCYQRQTLEQGIKEPGGGALQNAETFATPTTMDALPPKSEKALFREMTIARPGRSKPANLRDQVSNMDNWLWPTPQANKTTCSGEIVNADGSEWDGISKPHSKTTGKPITSALADAVQKWPAPQSRNYKGSSGRSIKGLELDLPTAVGGRLSPDWVEWLMLWPVGWTSLEPLPENAFDTIYPIEEPEGLPRVTSNCPNRAARLKAIGNGQVPLCAAQAWLLLLKRFEFENA